MFCLRVWLGYAPQGPEPVLGQALIFKTFNRKVADAALGRVPPEFTAPPGIRAFHRGSGVRPSGPLQ